MATTSDTGARPQAELIEGDFLPDAVVEHHEIARHQAVGIPPALTGDADRHLDDPRLYSKGPVTAGLVLGSGSQTEEQTHGGQAHSEGGVQSEVQTLLL